MAKRWGPGNPLYDWQQKHKGARALKVKSRGSHMSRKAKSATYHKPKHSIIRLAFFAMSLVPTVKSIWDGFLANGWTGAIQYPLYRWTGLAFNGSTWAYEGWHPEAMMEGVAPFVAFNAMGWGIKKAVTKFKVWQPNASGWGL